MGLNFVLDDTIADETFQQTLAGTNGHHKKDNSDPPKTQSDGITPPKQQIEKIEKKGEGTSEKPTCRFYTRGKCRHNSKSFRL